MENSFKKISDFILKQDTLKFKNLTKEDVGNNIENFFNNFFKYNSTKDTLNSTTDQIQTRAGKRRTINDIYLITKYYFPKIRLSTVYNNLIRLIKEKKVVSSLCEVLNTRVYRTAKNGDYGFNGFPKDEFKVPFYDLPGGKELEALKNKSLWGFDYDEDSLIYKNI